MPRLGIIYHITCQWGDEPRPRDLRFEVDCEEPIGENGEFDTFEEFSKFIGKAILPLNNQNLNELAGMEVNIENIAMMVMSKLQVLPSLRGVTVWQSGDLHASIFITKKKDN